MRVCFSHFFSHLVAGLCFILILAPHATTCHAEEPAAWAQANLEAIVGLYQHFHKTPELSFQEKETAARLAKELRAVGAEVTEGVGGTGVVGLLKNGSGKTVLLRTDLDALPVTEQTG